MFARQRRPITALDGTEPSVRLVKHPSALNPSGNPLLQFAPHGNTPLTTSLVQQLQRTHGNRYVTVLAERNRNAVPEIQRTCACGGTCDHCQEEDEGLVNRSIIQRELPFESSPFAGGPQDDKKAPEGFCTPFESDWELIAAKAKMTTVLLPYLLEKYGMDTFLLYLDYLTSPSSGAKLFTDEESAFVKSYAYSPDTTDEVVKIVEEIKKAIPGKVKLEDLPPGVEVRMNIQDFLGEEGLSRQTNYDHVDEAPGVTAGGVGSSDFGDDYRQISGYVVFVREVDGSGKTTVSMTTEISFTVADAIDFCPGDAGLPEEQKATLPLSRLEASGAAFDRPFVVTFERNSGQPVPIDPDLFQSGTPNGTTGSLDTPNDETGMAWNEWFESASDTLFS
ncbi:MAG: hypothetical protein K8L91_22840 [Anaerolineae bacterium]|nr:hypothetical protein [Anaerolineae bacterium]